MNLQNKIDETYPPYYDYEVDESKEQWKALLQDTTVCHEEILSI